MSQLGTGPFDGSDIPRPITSTLALCIAGQADLSVCAKCQVPMRCTRRAAARAALAAVTTTAALALTTHCVQAALAAPTPVLFVTQHGDEDASDPANAVQVRVVLRLLPLGVRCAS